MPKLKVTLIDVGWGDSIFIESEDSNCNKFYALIDSNDSGNIKSTYIFLKRFFEKEQIDIATNKPIFDWVMLSHAHLDHGQGLKHIIKTFGTQNFYYPKSLAWKSLAFLLKYANRSSNVGFHQSIDDTKVFNNFGDVSIDIVWPQHNQIYDSNNENNNSIVLLMTLDNVTFVLTGDAEEDVWQHIAPSLPSTTKFFKVPHHGSTSGTFAPGTTNSSYLDQLDSVASSAKLGISSHLVPYRHPDQRVVNEFKCRRYLFFRTDQNYHITYETDGINMYVKYARF